MVNFAVPRPKPKPLPNYRYRQQSIQNLINRERGDFKIGDDILYPDESNNHQVQQWKTGLGNALARFCQANPLVRNSRRRFVHQGHFLFLDQFESLPHIATNLR